MAARATLVIALVLSAVACGESTRRAGVDGVHAKDLAELPFPVHLTSVQTRGREVFDQVCASCHGRAGRGDSTSVPDVRGLLPDLSDKRYASLSSTELSARFAAAHGSSLSSVANGSATHAALSYLPVLAFPPDAPGSAVRGRELYGRYCVSCHGVHGDGKGPAALLLDARPADLTHNPLVRSRNFDALVRDTRDGPGLPHISSMPSWGLVFDDTMLRDVAAYLPTFAAPFGR